MTTEPHSHRNPPMVRMKLVPAPDDSSAPPSFEEIQSALERSSAIRLEQRRFAWFRIRHRRLTRPGTGRHASELGWDLQRLENLEQRPARPRPHYRAYDDIEVVATEMPEADVAKLFQLLDESDQADVTEFINRGH